MRTDDASKIGSSDSFAGDVADGTPRVITEPEAILLAALRRGDAAAYEQLVRVHGPRLLAVARRFLRCEQDCADAVQDAFISAFRSIDRFTGDSALGTWLYRIAVNCCLMKLRRQKRDGLTSIEPLLPSFKADGHHRTRQRAFRDDASTADGCGFDAAVLSESRDFVRACIDRLPDAYRTVVLLRDIEALSTEETAIILSCTTNNVKTRLHRARQALRSLLEPKYAFAAEVSE
jgi:RNA polymerase sigma-70 factor (ECF subfamily)